MNKKKESFAVQAARGSKWVGGGAIYNLLMQLLQLAVLSRFLEPADFGLVAMIMVVVGFAQVFSDMGISNAIIHRQDTTRKQLSSLYWLNIMAGCVVFALVVAVIPLIVNFYDEPRLEGLIFWAAFIFIIIPLGQQFQVLLQKELRFKILAKMEMAATTLGTVVAILAVINGQGVFSIILGQLSMVTARTSLLVGGCWGKWGPSLRFFKKDLTGYIGFGFFQMGERSISYFGKQLDKLLIGFFLGAQALGYYSIAHQLMLRPFQTFNPILTRVAFPVFSKMEKDNKRLSKNYLEVTRVIALVLMPVYLGMIILATPLLTVLLGEGWDTTISVFKVLAILGMFYSLGNPLGSLFLAKGRADIGFYMNLLALFLYGGAVWVGSTMGLNGIAWALVIVTAVVFFPIGFWVRWHLVGMRPLEYVKSFLPFLVFSCMVGVAIHFFSNYFEWPSVMIELLACLVFGTGIYAMFLVLFQRPFLKRLVLLARA